MRGTTHEERVMLWRRYISSEIGVRQIAPKSVEAVYIPGILSALTFHNADEPMRLAYASRAVKDTLKGFKKLHAEESPEGARIKVPWSVNLANESKRILMSKEVIPAQLRGLSAELLLLAIRRLHLAMLFGIFFLLRKSEFLDETPVRGAGGAAAAADGAAGAATSRTKKSTAQRRFVVFYDEANREIPYERIGITRASRIMFDVHRGKSDQFGKGRFNSHSRQASGTCLVTLMEEYFRDTRDKYKVKETDPIFQGGDLPRLTSDGLKQAMRLVAERLGLPADRISAHSLRYGGATLMASAGFPEFIIAQYGGWVEGSESLKVYIRPTRETIDSVSRHMASGGNATAEAELLMHVKSVHQIYLTSGATAADAA
jgi:hypothetical protein